MHVTLKLTHTLTRTFTRTFTITLTIALTFTRTLTLIHVHFHCNIIRRECARPSTCSRPQHNGCANGGGDIHGMIRI